MNTRMVATIYFHNKNHYKRGHYALERYCEGGDR